MTDGVLPTKFPSTSMSALGGVDETEILFTEGACIELSATDEGWAS